MAAPSLYNRMRPTHFRDVVGQDVVCATLQGAVRQGTVGHAYLFWGPRGTGKTSTARILARAATCTQPQDGEPCDACPSCLAVLAGSCLDITEIDAASHTSVDHTREVLGTLSYRPVMLSWRVLIIDEVASLSGPAFSALLKSLEEPPGRVLFILATTERHKVPATVASRCQVLPFRPLPPTLIAQHLAHVAHDLGLRTTAEALDLLARHADGALRDALGLLEQCQAYAQGQLDAQTVREAIGLPAAEVLADLCTAIASGDSGMALAQVAQSIAHGTDVRLLRRLVRTYFHDLLRTSVGATALHTTGDVPPGPAQSLTTAHVLAILAALNDLPATTSWPAGWHLERTVAEACLCSGATRSMPAPTAHDARHPPHDVVGPLHSKAQTPCVDASTVTPAEEERPPDVPAPIVQERSADRAPTGQTTSPLNEVVPSPAPIAQQPTTAMTDLQILWERVKTQLGQGKHRLALTYCGEATPIALAEHVLTITVPQTFYQEEISKEGTRRHIEGALSALLGRPIGLVCHVGSLPQGGEPAPDPAVEQVAAQLRALYHPPHHNAEESTTPP